MRRKTQHILEQCKIQGDSRKLLDHFKSYFGSHISQSLNEVHIYRLLPEYATKDEFFKYIFVFGCFKSVHVAL